METTSAYIISLIIALGFLLIAALIAKSIKFQSGTNPRDPQLRKMWFWILCILNPITILLLGLFVFVPDANTMVLQQYKNALYLGAGIGFVLYILLGFLLSRVFRNGKIGNWF